MPKQTKPAPNHKATKVFSAIKRHKLLSFLIALLTLVTGNLLYNKYLDWDNAQMIKGLSRDFPLLVEQIEQETGLDLEIQSNCMTTQEKFSSGVRTCEYLVVQNPISEQQAKIYERLVNQQSILIVGNQPDHRNEPYYKYRNKNSCDISTKDYVYLSCIVGVRDANVPKIKELLSGNEQP